MSIETCGPTETGRVCTRKPEHTDEPHADREGNTWEDAENP